MRSSFVATTGLKLARTPSARDRAARRRLAVIATMAGLAVMSGVVGAVSAPHGSHPPAARTGPFSYFPTE